MSSSPTVLKLRLKSAPFPLSGNNEDPRYTDATVLIVVPSGLDPEQPFEVVIYCHGFFTEIASQFGLPTPSTANKGIIFYGLDDQMERAARARILIAPQLPKSAADGSPGKLAEPGAAKAFLAEVEGVLSTKLFKGSLGFSGNFAAAPIIIASYSGGYRTATCLVHPGSGVPERVKAVLMLDSMYGKSCGQAFADWMRSTAAEGIFVSLARRGTPGKDDTMMQSLLVSGASGDDGTPPAAFAMSPGQIRVYDISAFDHLKIPVAGAPPSPLLTFLDGLPVLSAGPDTTPIEAEIEKDADILEGESKMAKVTLTQALKDEYNQLFALAKIRPENAFEIDAGVAKISNADSRAIYERLETKTGVPWYVIGIVHGLECNWSFKKHLHNGDPLEAKTVRVPAGRPKAGNPPFDFEDSAVDALSDQRGLGSGSNWSIAGICYMFEAYNGFGYRLFHPHVKSPYLWSYTTIYSVGKYVADGTWSETTKSRQCGAIALLKRLVEKGIVPFEVEVPAESDAADAPSEAPADADVVALMRPAAPPPFPGIVLARNRGTIEQVKLLQNRLLALGIDGIGKADGDFGEKTEWAVKLFQARSVDEAGNPLEIDGVVGPRTWRALFGQPSAEHFPDLTPAADTLAADLIAIAGTQVGVREQPLGSNRGPEVDMYMDRVDSSLRGGAWCVAFVYWCVDEASRKNGKPNPMPRTASVWRHWEKAQTAPGATIVAPAAAKADPSLVKPGMIFHIDTGGRTGHVGIIADVQGQTLITIEGNTNDGGSREGIGVFIRKSRKISQIDLGFVGHSWP